MPNLFGWWRRWHRRRWFWRWPMKGAVVLLAAALVCFPYPGVLYRHLQHLRNPQALVDGDNASLASWHAALDREWSAAPAGAELLPIVQRFVIERVPYAYDWETWGVADYLPTVDEVVARGREDCDGRAVVAASLLHGLGVEARLVADGAHVWVWTPLGETMGPNAVATVSATPNGLRFHWAGLRSLPRAVAFGVAVFPWQREALVLMVLWLVLLHPGIGWRRAAASAALLAVALILIRAGGAPWHQQRFGLLLAGVTALLAVPAYVQWVGSQAVPKPA